MQNLNQNKYVEGLFSFIDKSPSPFHVIETTKEMLTEAGFQEVQEKESWKLNKGGSYFVVRNDSSIIAFQIPEKEWKGFHMVASHSDSPSFKIKNSAFSIFNVLGYRLIIVSFVTIKNLLAFVYFEIYSLAFCSKFSPIKMG